MIYNDTLTVIRRRRSIRKYRPEQIKDDELSAILEAGMYAPNAGDEAWHFIVLQNKELLAGINTAAKEAARNSEMKHLQALGSNEKFDCLYGAPTLIIISCDKRALMPLEPECAAALENMLIAAESLGVSSCWIYFTMLAFDSPRGMELREALKIPGGHRPVCSAVFGYRDTERPSPPERKPNLVTYIK